MKILDKIYGLEVGDTRHRSKLKQTLKYSLNSSVLNYISCLIIHRYGSYYVNKLSNIRKDYPGLETFLKVDCQSKHKVTFPYEQLQINMESKLLTKMQRLQVNIFNLIEKYFCNRLPECYQIPLFSNQNISNILDSHKCQLLYVIKPWKVLQTFRKREELY